MATHPDGTRDCGGPCGRRLPLEDFWFENKLSGKRHYRCKECHGQYIRIWVAANGEKRKAAVQRYGDRAQSRFKRYGITRDIYDQMLKAQGGVCAICGKPDQDRNLHIDHDETTNQIRGLLCNGCNTGIGKFYHNPRLLMAAARFLMKFEETPSYHPV
jgi:hypothetical protein